MISGPGKVLDHLPLKRCFRAAAANLQALSGDEKLPSTQEVGIVAGDNAPPSENVLVAP
jgi:hypothetical protein